ncbi:MAG: GNAT family N-acetyltransferase [Nitrospinae bacterium]|nr:GNAT family N-acetyltransferase [Nitrospinota bacterium]
MEIVEITARKDFGYKRFFTAGLERHDDCFRISPWDEANAPFPTNGTPYSFTLAALSEKDELMRVASFKLETDNRVKLSYKGLLFRMYVASEYAGRGIGGKLIRQVIDRAKALDTIEQINLTALTSNERAESLYLKFGFQVFETEKNSVKSDSRYYDEDLMVLFLKSAVNSDS